MTTIETLNKRAKAKFIQEPLILALIDLQGKFTKQYTDTLQCASLIYHKAEKLTSRYCRNRWCRVCNRIRTGQLINGYEPALEAMPDKHLVTLTIKNVPGETLRRDIQSMTSTIRAIQTYRRQVEKLPGINAIRKLEVTYNAEQNNFHPHFHLIVSTQEEAEYLKSKWVERRTDANEAGQDIREAYNPRELFKYFAKLTSATSQTVWNGGKIRIKNEDFYPEALDIIFQSMKGLRIVQPMGKIRYVSEEIDEIQADEIDETVTHNGAMNQFYLWVGENWASPFTGELLTSYRPSAKICKYRQKIRYLEPKEAG